MTSRPRLVSDVNYRNGVGALLLFAVLAWTFLTAGFQRPVGFGEGSITAGLGYAMFDMVDQAAYATESFLVAFEIIDVVLVAALVGAVMLARREEDGSVVTAITDGGRLLGGDEDSDESATVDAENATADADDAGAAGSRGGHGEGGDA